MSGSDVEGCASGQPLSIAQRIREIDFILERSNRRIIAVEVLVACTITDRDGRHPMWLREPIGPDLLDAVLISTGPDAYRRPNGIALIAAALLGP